MKLTVSEQRTLQSFLNKGYQIRYREIQEGFAVGTYDPVIQYHKKEVPQVRREYYIEHINGGQLYTNEVFQSDKEVVGFILNENK